MAGGMGKPRKSGEPQAATVRKIGILLDLVRHKRISMRGCKRTYDASERTVLRDLQELRDIGETAGFRIGERMDGDYFELTEFKSRPAKLLASEKRLRALVSELFKAFGEPVHDVAEGFGAESGAGDGRRFLHLVQPQLTDGSAVAKIYRALEDAWQNDARVEFRYRGAPRRVEPAAAVVRAGRYYLIGRDVAKGRDGWRNFSMDLIVEPIRRCGTFKRAAAPAKYLSDTVGFFKGDGPEQTVAVTLSAAVAASAISRRWQEAQRVRRNRDGTVTISFVVDDVDEVVRWALGYGDEAWISAPPAAVARARAIVAEMQERYSPARTHRPEIGPSTRG
jgi:predicted DNA-binding transcriptional regulator YafY